ncbi:heavy-metal-associated domain-containing protein [bacterium]|nr:heavy-metal-associated domain-containing protein [bacterium]
MPVETLELGVNGMSCGHCAARVEKFIRQQVQSVEDVKVDLEGRKVTVRCDTSKAGVKEIAAAVEAAGYSPVLP